jgi:hypothetical protein
MAAVALETSFFASWPETALERAKRAPKVTSLKARMNGVSRRVTHEEMERSQERSGSVFYKVPMPQDTFGSREEGARFHTHFLPLYPIGTAREVIARDYFEDMVSQDMFGTGNWRYSEWILPERLDPKVNMYLYEWTVDEYVDGLSQRFLELQTDFHNEREKRFDHLTEFFLKNPMKSSTLRADLEAGVERHIAKNPSSKHEPEFRAYLFKHMLDTLFEYMTV